MYCPSIQAGVRVDSVNAPKATPVRRKAVDSKLGMLSERIVPEPVGEA